MHAIKNSTIQIRLGEKVFALFKQLTGLFFGKLSIFADMVAQVTARHQINDKVQVISILKGIVHIDEESNNIKFSLKQLV